MANPAHTYTAAGTYTAVLTVSDGTYTVSQSLVISVNPGLDIKVMELKIDAGDENDHKVKGKVNLRARFAYAGTPAADDLIKIAVENYTILEVPFSQFVLKNGNYIYKEKHLSAEIDFNTGRIKVSRHKMLLDEIDNSNGVTVVISFGDATGIDNFVMKVEGHDDHCDDHKKKKKKFDYKDKDWNHDNDYDN